MAVDLDKGNSVIRKSMRAKHHFVGLIFLVLSKAISLIFAIQRLEPAGMGEMEREQGIHTDQEVGAHQLHNLKYVRGWRSVPSNVL